MQRLDAADKDRQRTLLVGVSEARLYEAALTIMMRLVFLFSAEERGMLLLGDPPLRCLLRGLDPARPTTRNRRSAWRRGAGTAARCLEPPAGHPSAWSMAGPATTDCICRPMAGGCSTPMPSVPGRAGGRHALGDGGGPATAD